MRMVRNDGASNAREEVVVMLEGDRDGCSTDHVVNNMYLPYL